MNEYQDSSFQLYYYWKGSCFFNTVFQIYSTKNKYKYAVDKSQIPYIYTKLKPIV